MKKLLLALSLIVLLASNALADQIHDYCTEKLDFSWVFSDYSPNTSNYTSVTFKFKSKTGKPIIIEKILIKTTDNQVIRSLETNSNLIPYGVLELKMSVSNLNRDMIKFGSYHCEYGTYIEKKTNNIPEQSGREYAKEQILGRFSRAFYGMLWGGGVALVLYLFVWIINVQLGKSDEIDLTNSKNSKRFFWVWTVIMSLLFAFHVF